MKKFISFGLFLVTVAVHGQGTAFKYQGRLNRNGAPANGVYDFRCQIFDAADIGNAVSGSVMNSSVPVSNGLFMLELDFGSAVFNGAPRWLAIAVRTNSGGSFEPLAARQRVSPSPYAIYAGSAGNLASGVNQTFTGAVSFNPASGPPFMVDNNTTLVPNLNADLLDGLDSSAFVRKSGDTLSGNLTLANPATLNFGSSVRQMINLWDAVYGIGVQSGTLYFRSDGTYPQSGHFAWYRGGTHSDGLLDPGDDGTALMTLENTGRLTVYGQDTTTTIGMVGSVIPNGIAVWARANGPSGNALYGEATGPRGTAVYGRSIDADGTAIQGSSAFGHAGMFFGAVRIEGDSTHQKPFLQIHETEFGDYARIQLKVTGRGLWHISSGGSDNSLVFYNESNSIVTAISETGVLTTKVLTITGGADIAEPFEMSQPEIDKGAVVVIDEDNPGKLKLSDRAYDTRVAGVVSGAGGVRPGLTLQQECKLDDGQHVALTGRVYVQADASDNAIKPGDLLTTSETPGHAMKVVEHARAQGAILGKAMTSLKAGKGLVLVLVTLQ